LECFFGFEDSDVREVIKSELLEPFYAVDGLRSFLDQTIFARKAATRVKARSKGVAMVAGNSGTNDVTR